MHYSCVIIFLMVSPFAQLQSLQGSEKELICVVGAGISGLSIATLLQNRGHEVIVFEKESRVGGKAETFRKSDEIQVEMCPLFYGSWSKPLIHYIDKFKLTPVHYNDSDRVGYDANSGIFHVIPPPTISETIIVGEAVLRYLFHRSFYERDLEFGFINASPDLFVSMLEWLEVPNLEALIPILTTLVTVEGYGSLDDVPALYALKFVSKPLLLKVTKSPLTQGAFYTIKEGFEVLVNNIASSLNVRVNHDVSHIITEKYQQKLIFKQYDDKSHHPVFCSKTILAFPPLLSSLNKILRLSPEEKELFQQVKIHKYTSAANHIPSLDHFVYFETFKQQSINQPIQIVPPSGFGEVVALLKQDSKKMKNVYSSYSWIKGSYNSTATNSELFLIEDKLHTFIKKINRNSKTFYQKSSEYFPHVSTKSLQQGFYKKFDEIQGKRRLYYATTLLGFETINDALIMTEGLVRRYF